MYGVPNRVRRLASGHRDSSGGAIVRLSDGDERVLSAVVRVSRTVMTTSGLTGERLAAMLPGFAVDLVRRKAEVDPSWVQQHRSETDVPIIVTDANVLGLG